MNDIPSLRAERMAAGLTQAELADRAGVSRQLVAAVETGRNLPSVEAALALARALGTSVEVLFARPAREVVPVRGPALRDGVPLRIGQVGTRLVAAELPDHGVAGAWWAAADGVWTSGQLELFPGARPAGTVIAGCDPAIGIAEAMLGRAGPRSLMAVSAPTGDAIAALAGGTVHAAIVHDRPEALPGAPLPVVRWHLAAWQVGLALPARLAGRSLDALIADGVTIVQRDPGAASQQAFLRAVAAAGATAPQAGPRATGHLEAARLAGLLGAAAVTTAAAAHAFGLTFVGFEDHTVEIWIAARWQDAPGVAALGEVLATGAFTRRVAQFGGYDLTGCGVRIADGPGPRPASGAAAGGRG